MATIAVMQPYFFPYIGYFRLFAESDLFVFYDCVQFPRRGFVHRNRMPKILPSSVNDKPSWLTLPIAYHSRDTRIADLNFSATASDDWRKRLSEFQWLNRGTFRNESLYDALLSVTSSAPVCDYLIESLCASASLLGVLKQTLRSSELSIDPELRGQARILAIVERLEGKRYINAPGGIELYDAEAFSHRGIELQFLPPYSGPSNSLLYELTSRSLSEVRAALTADRGTTLHG